MENKNLFDVVSEFAIKGKVLDIKPLGNGLINKTYLVHTEDGNLDYVLQCINHSIFPDVEMLMNNIIAVTDHIRRKLEAEDVKDLERRVLTFIECKANKKYYFYDGANYWRVMICIPDVITKTAVNAKTSKIVGETFGQFQKWLADIPVQLGETIKNFHNMEFRLEQLDAAIKADKSGRLHNVTELVEALKNRSYEMCKGERLYREGLLPKRICHCDTKVDNILFDKDGGVLCVIDLDTVMPNYVFSDFGDFMRSAANTGEEDDKNLDNVSFNMEIFKAFTEGYLRSAASFLTPIEIENLPFAAKLFPYMQSIRFLMDYIDGDLYFRTQYPEHNLVRAKAQYKLFQSADAQEKDMAEFIDECIKKVKS